MINLTFWTWIKPDRPTGFNKIVFSQMYSFLHILIPKWNLCVSFCTECRQRTVWTTVLNAGALSCRSNNQHKFRGEAEEYVLIVRVTRLRSHVQNSHPRTSKQFFFWLVHQPLQIFPKGEIVILKDAECISDWKSMINKPGLKYIILQRHGKIVLHGDTLNLIWSTDYPLASYESVRMTKLPSALFLKLHNSLNPC